MRILFLLLCLLSCPLQAALLSEPSFEEIRQVALQHSGLKSVSVFGLEKRVRRSAWLPAFYVGYDRALRETDSLAITDNISVTGNGVTIGPEDNNFDQTVVSGDTIRFRAAWNLDRLVFNTSELQVMREQRDQFKTQLEFSDYLFKIYAERKKLLAEYLAGSKEPRVVKARIESLTDHLNAFTQNQFKDRFWKGGKL